MCAPFARKVWRSIRYALLVLGLVLAGLSFLWVWSQRRVDPARIREQAWQLASREGIVIGFDSPSTFFVPPYQAADARFASGDSATKVEDFEALVPALDGIENALSAYPQGFFAKHCHAIFLCGSLKLDGTSAGGTWSKSWIILSADPRFGRKGLYENARLGVHHELSSLVWSRFPELQGIWKRLLPPGWTPAKRNADALTFSDDFVPHAEDGFLSRYGATSSENDFNVYAEAVFTAPSYAARQAEAYLVVARKLALLMEAYVQLDARCGGMFERLGLQRFRPALPAPVHEGISIAPVHLPKGEIVSSKPAAP